ncbi:hypothetical protein LWC33_30195, partial [Pseudonocardia sp. RS11V-5]|nr:hypothetical protein [Pseudonocardia terrae]
CSASTAAGRVAAVLAEQTREVGLVVRGPSPGGLAPSDVAAALELPLLASMPPERNLARAMEQGVPPGRRRGALNTAARELLIALADTGAPGLRRAS